MSIAMNWPDHLLTLDEWDALDLPGDLNKRVELVEGVLVLSPSPRARHQAVLLHLGAQLDAAGGDGWSAVPDIDVVLDAGPTPTVRQPDVVVVPSEIVDDRPHVEATDVLAVFEVLSPGTTRIDRVLKMHEYAEAGIPLYGIVDARQPPGAPAVLTEFRLVEGLYEKAAEHRGRASLGLGVTVDLDAL